MELSGILKETKILNEIKFVFIYLVFLIETRYFRCSVQKKISNLDFIY